MSTFIIMGPSGSGKTTLGQALAAHLHIPFIDGDDLHPAPNIAKMTRGEPLTDADRAPWLARIAETIATHAASGTSIVIACSALKRIYRDTLRGPDPTLRFILLEASQQTLEQRLKQRPSHFMPAALVANQLATLEPPGPDERAIVLDATQPIGELVRQTVAAIGA